ncbi:hypothetical protein RRG08_022717 [Elysia crispata]|uniref:ABC transporter domain-containing protein n=1 Tax=Elysia crispata TaxID=231223 RepID=A0AAE1DFM5_9GAST|nr:hypothetical protein RRG08_022717 [Elysia crispata]
MAEEKRSLLGGANSNRRRGRRRQYTEPDQRHISIEMSHSSSYKERSLGSSSRTPRLSDAFEQSAQYQISLAWKDITVKVNIPGKRGFSFGEAVPPEQKTILRNASGIAAPGCLLAIIGASGSGKSTLLNVLTQRNTKDYIIGGEMFLNGVLLSPGAIRNISAYVQQSDMFMDTLTVREQLQFRALLRMDRKLDRDARLARVENVIHEMGLSEVANYTIGATGGGKKGISGGERKRLAFACESLTNPPIFFCDEPMSGLDSFMAQSILVTLRDMAKRGRCILCTVHQPSSELFAMFNHVLILSAGRTAFMGTTTDCLKFFNQIKYPCPSHYNPSDHYILTLAIIPGKDAECYKKSGAICDAFERSEQAKSILAEIEEQKQEEQLLDHVVIADVTGESRYASAWSVQLTNLFWRAWVCQFRDSTVVSIKIFQCVALGMLMGLIWFRTDVNQKGVNNFNAAILEMMLCVCMNTVLNVIMTFPHEIALVKREYGTGIYDAGLYFISKTISEFPLYLFIGLLLQVLVYWMTGMNDSGDAFVFSLLVTAFVVVNSICTGLVISVVAGNYDVAIVIGSPILLLQMLFSGFMINLKDIPDYLKWMNEITFTKNAYRLLMVNQWNGYDTIPCPNSTDIPANISIAEKCARLACPYTSGQAVLDYISIEDEMGHDLLQMSVLAVGFYLVALVGLIIRARLSRE